MFIVFETVKIPRFYCKIQKSFQILCVDTHTPLNPSTEKNYSCGFLYPLLLYSIHKVHESATYRLMNFYICTHSCNHHEVVTRYRTF